MIARLTYLVLLALLALAGPVAAQQGGGPEQMLTRMDRDGDGRIAAGEWMGPPRAFTRLDSDRDGYLTVEELAARAAGRSPAAAAPRAGNTTFAWIDTHVHLRKGSGSYAGALRHAVELMDEAGVRAMVLMSPPFPGAGNKGNRYGVAELARLTKSHPGRFHFLGGGDRLNGIVESTPPEQVTEALRADFARQAEAILAAGARGFGEIGMMHFGHFPGHPSYWVAPDHPLFLLLADIAGQHRAVIDVHMDVVEHEARTPHHLSRGENPPRMPANVALFERFVAHNRSARIVLAHAGWDASGQWSAALSGRLLAAHPNLYMSLKIADQGSSSRNRLMTDEGSGVAADWLAVLEAFPDRFVIGSDSFIAEVGAKGRAPGGMTRFHGERIAALLQALPPALAQRVALQNALALYGAP